ncbi:DUF5134 domain-containing protein [Mycobacterium europaeum]|uniref:DUF5134 domain-containing protein n=1 Tax=Mycobacterium europaeum TaxID=761804 RepID=UPI002ADF610F|nr:DUF5134 domain-containing protein [Mycobacterium europaeum]MEA1162324.1 DUF5134 domain-containing protein [Mycobacterium europaeum]
MIHDPLLRWLVTGFFALGALECALPILTQRRPWTVVVGHSLHFLMAVSMAVMAWPWSMRLPTMMPAVFFLLAALWFATMGLVAARPAAQRGLFGYHSLMMLATAWMYAGMNSPLPSAQSHPQAGATTPGMDMAAMNMSASSESPTWFSAVNWFGTTAFAIATIFWTRRYVTSQLRGTTRARSLGNIAQAMMAAGMAVLFLAALFEI